MDSYSSGSAGGYSSRTDVHFCANGQFALSGNSSVSVDVGGAYGYTGGDSQGSGTWRIITEGQIAGIELRYARAADHLSALERAVRESIIDREILTRRTYDDVKPKTINYLSLEYLLGRLLGNNLIATGLFD